MTAGGWPDPDPRVSKSFAEDSPVGDRWQNRVKAIVYPLILPLQTRLVGVRLGLEDLKAPLTWGSRGAEFDYVISRLGKSRIEAKRLLIQGVGDGKEFLPAMFHAAIRHLKFLRSAGRIVKWPFSAYPLVP